MVIGLRAASHIHCDACPCFERSARDRSCIIGWGCGVGRLFSALQTWIDRCRAGGNPGGNAAGGEKIFKGDSTSKGGAALKEDFMNIWLVMLLGGLITFLIRFSLIYLFGKFKVPETMRQALRYVPPAVLSAIIFPELFLHDGTLHLAFENIRLLAGLIAIAVAWFSKNTLITIIAGMLALFLLQLVF